MVVRRAYAEEDFEWYNVVKLMFEFIVVGNECVMCEWFKFVVLQSV